MFGVRFITPPVPDEQGQPVAGAQIRLGTEHLPFIVDLRHWGVGDYERQWREGTSRLLHGAPSTALMMAYRGPEDATHQLWALWRESGYVHAQRHSVVATTAEPFNPTAPYEHVGDWVPASENALPISEWRVDLVQVYAAALGVRWPMYPGR